MSTRAKHLILVSLDGFSTADAEFARGLPHLGWMLKNGLHVPEIVGIYPTQTYPLHVSLTTGTFPHRHGVVSNTRVQPGRSSPDWYWYRKDIAAPCLYDIATASGYTVASLLWPGAGGARLDVNLPEIQPTRKTDNLFWLVLSNGTALPVLDLFIRFGRKLRGLDKTYVDDFITDCAAHVVRTRTPNLLLVHLLDLDSKRHRYGFQSNQARTALSQEDVRIGRLIRAVEDAGITEETAFVVLGDHAYMDVHSKVNLNVALRTAGLIELTGSGRLRRWDAWANCCDGSAHIHLRDQQDERGRNTVRRALADLQADTGSTIDAVFEGDQIRKLGLGDTMDFVVEAGTGYYCSAGLGGAVVEPTDAHYRATHGYLPTKAGYTSMMLGTGMGLSTGDPVMSLRTVDLGPTLARILGLEMPDAEGKIIGEILT